MPAQKEQIDLQELNVGSVDSYTQRAYMALYALVSSGLPRPDWVPLDWWLEHILYSVLTLERMYDIMRAARQFASGGTSYGQQSGEGVG
jgi:hypothetical protein